MKLLSERLKYAMAEEGKRRGAEVRAADVARAAGSSAASVNYWLTDANGMGAAKARLVGEFLHVNSYWLETGEGGPHIPPMGIQRLQTVYPKISASHPDDDKLDDVIYVPESRIEFAGGGGRTAQFELIEDEEPATYRLSWFQKNGLNPERVRRFRVSGDSMVPMLWPRDTILVNTEETTIVDGKMYAIRYGDELRVKYLSRRLDGTIILRSVNPSYRDEEVSPGMAEEHISIIGRVRDTSGTGGL